MRTVIEELNVCEIIDKEQAIYPRLEAAYDALKWWLSHVPESGEIIDDLHWIYKQRGYWDVKLPAMTVLYTFDAKYVTFQYLLLRIPTVER